MTSPENGDVGRAMLVGSPRSGTTWFAKLIDSHPDVLYRHEPDSIKVRPDIPFVPSGKAVSPYLDSSREYLDMLFAERGSKSAGSQPMFAKSFRSASRERLRQAIIFGVKGGERVLEANRWVADLQIPDLLGGGEPAPRLQFMKSVSSLCRTYMFSQADPGMKFLHIVRHPCAYVASTTRGKSLGLLSDDAYIETLAKMPEAAAYGWTLDTLRSLSREEQLAARWMLQNDKVVAEMDGQANYKLVVYEELCADPSAVIKDVFDFLGLVPGEQTQGFIEESSVGKGTEVKYFDVKRDSASAAIGWRKELAEKKIKQIEGLVAPSRVGAIYR